MGAINTQIQGIIDKLYADTLIPGLDLTVSVTFRRFARQVYDPDSPSADLGSAITQTVNGLMRPVRRTELNDPDGLKHDAEFVIYVKHDETIFPTFQQRGLGMDNEIQVSSMTQTTLTQSNTENYIIVSSEQLAVGEQKLAIKMFVKRVRL